MSAIELFSFFRPQNHSATAAARPRFSPNDGGATAVIFAICLVPVIGLVGLSIDYGRAVAARAKLQAATDAAVLAGAQQSSPDQRHKIAGDVLAASLADSTFDAEGVATWKTDASGAFTGRFDVKMTNAFMGLFGSRTTPIGVTATAMVANAMTPSSSTFELRRATGASWKEVELYIHEVGAASDTLVQSFVYQPGWNDGGITQPTGTMTVTQYAGGAATSTKVYNQNSDFTWPAGVASTVALGTTYDKIYLVMTVQGDGCAAGFANTSRKEESSTGYTYNKDSATNDCVPEGTSHSYTSSWTTKTTVLTKNLTAYPKAVYSTDSTAGASNLFVGLKAGTTDQGAVQMSEGVKPSVFDVFPCDGKSSVSTYYAWEDTRQDASNRPWTGSWANQDMIFKVTLGCTNANTQFRSSGARLVK